MVCVIQQPEFPKSIGDPRDWSHQWDGQQPPLPGQLAFCTMLIGVRRKAHWRPRTADSLPPVAFVTGSGLFTWTRSYEAAVRDVAEFNANQLRRLPYKRFGVKLWAAVGWGICGFEETIRIIDRTEGGRS